jgi:hypothetical protein
MKTGAFFCLFALMLAPCEAGWADRVLAEHNAERAAVHVAPLSWSEPLAADAAVWAKALAGTGRFEHSPLKLRRGQGENLWKGTAGHYGTEDMVDGWVAEKRWYRDEPVETQAHDPVVGHYTQMIWSTTTRVGCAIASGRGWDVLVCRYSPPGNIIGERPF